MLKRNQIPTFRIGGHWRFNLEEIDNWSRPWVRRR
jgi:excisionase family DNA binding protein